MPNTIECRLNLFRNDQILDLSKLNAFADEKNSDSKNEILG